MSRLLRRASRRHLLRHPWQAGFSVLGVALGVAVVVSIDLANGSALTAFRLSSQAVTGRATHQIAAGPAGFAEDLYRELRVERGLRPSAPLVEGWVSPSGRPERPFRLLGVDPFAEADFRDYLDPQRGEPVDVAALMTRPGAVALARSTANELGLEKGDSFSIEHAGRLRELTVVALLDLEGSAARAASDLLLADLSTAQETLGFEGRLSRIDLLLDEEREPAAAARLSALLPPGVELARSDARTGAAEEMTAAFRLNLRALSFLALLCGAFLIYNTITFAVVQRRRLLGTLRALGTTRREIFALILGEAALIGLIGGLLGLAAGAALGRLLVEQVTRTINDLYFVLSVRQLELSPLTLGKGMLLGIGASLLAALAPSLEATSASPRSALDRAELESLAHRAVPRASALGLGLLIVGAALLLLRRELPLSFAAIFAILVGFALLTPAATLFLVRLLTPLAGLLFGQLGRLAGRGVVAALSRTGVAVAALMLAISVAVGVDLMIRSFRGTVEGWLEYSLPADLYLSATSAPASRLSGVLPGFTPELAARLAVLPGVARVNTLRRTEIPTPDGPARLIAVDLDHRSHGAFGFQQGDPERAWPAFEAGEAVLVSEPFAYRRGVEVGARLELPTPKGIRSFPVAAVFFDYASERGTLLMARDLYQELWGDASITAISVHVEPGLDSDRVADEIRASAAAGANLTVRSNRALRQESLRVFDRTFLVTGVLRLLAVMVAFVGVLSALTALQLERARELGVLRANGLTPAQVWRLVTSQTGIMGLTAGLLAVPVGLTTAAIMIYIINRRSFGWSLEMSVAPGPLLGAIGLAVGAALLAGLYPALRMSRTSPAEALREE